MEIEVENDMFKHKPSILVDNSIEGITYAEFIPTEQGRF